ncbi:MAG: tRNA pseudouridine(13) synthase TruD, partial [Halobacteriaceae archaeon]
MREAHPIEQSIGIEWYMSDVDGIGGVLRKSPEDFIVREREEFETEPIESDPRDYPHLIARITLRDWDTNDFARELSNRLGLSRGRIGWAGTKDRRAVTTQLFSVKTDENDLPAIPDADITIIGRAGRPLRFGDLAGNDFQITIANPADPAQANQVLDSLGEGESLLPNFFGQQRFGSRRTITHEVGLHILHRNWEKAVLTYVGNPSENEPEESQNARKFVEETQDWKGALKEFPNRLRYERAICHELANGKSFKEALESLPSNLQRLFVHAAQSYIFNRIISERLTKGIPIERVIEGDIACFTEKRDGLRIPNPDQTQQAN